MAHVMASFSQFERRLIGQRTKEALAVKRAQGVRLGRPVGLPPEVVRRIVRARRRGRTLAAIASRLNRDGVATAQGGAQWWPSTVKAVLVSADVDFEAGVIRVERSWDDKGCFMSSSGASWERFGQLAGQDRSRPLVGGVAHRPVSSERKWLCQRPSP